ncbi:MAG TPA: T9SS type A sorting domain-containing protein [Bacteroidia bacterium]
MKKLLLASLFLGSFISASAQCSELFFSEYVEGSNNNKALEIYNPTANPITIHANEYRIVRYNNGTAAVVAEGSTQAMVVLGQHTIQPYDVWVLVIDKRNPAGTGNDLPVDLNLQAVADTFICPDYNVSFAIYHNGDDALSLQKNVGGNWVYVDIIGEIGVDPDGSSGATGAWTDCAPLFDATCGAYYTKDQTMIRKPATEAGYTSNPSPFDPTQTWDTLPNNTFTMLGSHTCDCNNVGVKEIVKHSEVKLFPNPANGSAVTFVSADKKIATISFTNALGQKVKSIRLESPALKAIQELNLSKGVYVTEIIFEDNSSTTEKLIIE